jgi:nicotinic acid mononucleotide adenylyltransferase
MKKYSQLLKELPSKKVVFAFGRFQPPTTGHELLVKAVQKLAASQQADHIIYASKTEDKKQNPLPVSRKVYYLQRMFPGINFRAANEQVRTFIEAAKELNKKYKNIVMVAGSDRVSEYKKLLERYNGTEFNFDTVTVVSAGERDPDSDTASGMSGTKMRESAKEGNFKEFKKGVPRNLTDLDARRLMNEIRKAYDMTPVKESLNIQVDELREKYFRGEIFNVGDIVMCEDKHYTVVKRGSNHLLLNEVGTEIKVNRWIKDVSLAEKYKETGKEEMQESLTNKTLKPSSTDQIKAARIIATTLGADNVEAMSNPKQIVNIGLRKIRNKALNPESYSILQRMLKMASDIGIEYDTSLLPSKLKEAYYDKVLSYDVDGKVTEIDVTKETFPTLVVKNMTVGHTLHDDESEHHIRKQKVKYHLGEANGDPKKLARDVAKAALAARHAREKEAIAAKHTAEKERIAEEEQLDEISSKLAGNYYGAATKKHIEKVGVKPNMYGRIEKDMGKNRKAGVDRAMDRITGARKTNEDVDLSEDIKKEYESLKKHDIKHLRDMIKTQHKIVDTSEFRTKEHAISHYLRAKHGNKRVADAFGLKEEVDYEYALQALDEAISTIDKGEYDYEGAMSRTQLQTVIRNSQELIDMLSAEDNMPEWVQSKITLAQDYISSVRDYLKSREELGESALNPKDPHGDYQAKRKALHDLSLDKDVDQKHVQQRRLDLDKEYSKHQKEGYIQSADTKIGKDGKKHTARLIKIGSDSPGERRVTGKDVFSEESDDEEHEISDAEIESMVNGITDWEHIIDAYDDDELAIIDDETGEEIHSSLKEEVEELNEVLSRIERIKSKARFARTKTKRMVKAKIALKRSSPQSTINKRARRLAIKNLKMRIAKKPLKSLSVAEKERLEQRVSKMKPILNRIAMRLAPKVRQIEKSRLSHSTYTK